MSLPIKANVKRTSTLYRIIVEFSSMRNNDEWVYFTDRDLSSEDRVEALRNELHKQQTMFRHPKLVMCRPVFKEEIAAKLNTNYDKEYREEKAPEITRFIDAFYRLRDDYLLRKKLNPKFTLTKWAAHYIAYDFYDCMSGGAHQMDLTILQHICRRSDIDTKEQVYPRSAQEGEEDTGDLWHTIADFLKEMEESKLPKFEDVIATLGLSTKQLTWDA